MRRDLGGDLTRAQETILEAAAETWVILSSVDDYISRQPSLVTQKRQLLPVVVQRMQIAEARARGLERLGLERKAKALGHGGRAFRHAPPARPGRALAAAAPPAPTSRE